MINRGFFESDEDFLLRVRKEELENQGIRQGFFESDEDFVHRGRKEELENQGINQGFFESDEDFVHRGRKEELENQGIRQGFFESDEDFLLRGTKRELENQGIRQGFLESDEDFLLRVGKGMLYKKLDSPKCQSDISKKNTPATLRNGHTLSGPVISGDLLILFIPIIASVVSLKNNFCRCFIDEINNQYINPIILLVISLICFAFFLSRSINNKRFEVWQFYITYLILYIIIYAIFSCDFDDIILYIFIETLYVIPEICTLYFVGILKNF